MSVAEKNFWFRAQQHRIRLAGMTHANADGSSRQALLKKLASAGGDLELIRDAGNKFDPNAIAVFCSFGQLGHVASDLAREWGPAIDDGSARLTCGYFKVDEWTPDDGRTIQTLEFDVNEWRQDTKPRRTANPPPPQRTMMDLPRRSVTPPRLGKRSTGVFGDVAIVVMALVFIAGIAKCAGLW